MFGFLKRRRKDPETSSVHPRVALPDRYSAIYAVGDVHGCLAQITSLEVALLADARACNETALILYLGDLIDRGPDSAAVLDRILAPGVNRLCLMGNHEAMFLAALEARADLDRWLEFGGADMVASYGLDPGDLRRMRGPAAKQALLSHIPEEHIEFIRAMPVAAWSSTHFFAHAGISPDRNFADQTDRDLLWIREPFLSSQANYPLQVVHGHTPAKQPVVMPNRICVDTGSYATGALTAVKLKRGITPRFFSVGQRAAAAS